MEEQKIKVGDYGIEITSEAIEKAVEVVKDIRNKVEDGLQPTEILQIVLGNSDEVLWILANKNAIKNELGDIDGNIQEGEQKELIEDFLTAYQAPTKEEEYMVERIFVAAFAVKDAWVAVGDFVNKKQ